MRKKRLLVISLIFALAFAAGCGSKNSSSQSNDSSVQQAETQEKEADNVSAEKEDDASDTAALDVENDTFSCDGAVAWIGTPVTDVMDVLGVQEEAETYDTQLFGEDVSVGLINEEGSVESVQITFPSTDMESVAIAVSEQLGQDGTETDGAVKWTFEDKEVVLTQSENGCVIDIH